MKEKTVDIYCSRELYIIHHLANHLENGGIEFMIVGDTSTTVLGIENPTQQICIRIFQGDVIEAKRIIEQHLPE